MPVHIILTERARNKYMKPSKWAKKHARDHDPNVERERKKQYRVALPLQ